MKLLFHSAVVGGVYALCGIFFYRARVTSSLALWKSDLVVFYLPALVSFFVSATVAWRGLPESLTGMWRAASSVGAGLATTVLAGWVYGVFAFSMYGT